MLYIGKSLVDERIIDPPQRIYTVTSLWVAKAIDEVIHEYYEGDVTGILIKANPSDNISFQIL